MWTLRVVLRTLLGLFLILSLASAAAPEDPVTSGQENDLLTPKQAALVAHSHLLREKKTIPSWEGAVIASPQPHYDLDGHVAAYVFSVVSDGSDAGYITVSSKDLPNPVIEFSTAPAHFKATQAAVRSTVDELGSTINEQEPLYLGMLAYFYRLGDQEPIRLIEMNTQQLVTLDAAPLSYTQRQTSNPPDLSKVLSDAWSTEVSDSAVRSTLYKLLYGPDYAWYRGCGPTAVANAMGHWADRGYPNLMYGGSGGDYLGTIDQLAALMGTSSSGWTYLPINDDIRS